MAGRLQPSEISRDSLSRKAKKGRLKRTQKREKDLEIAVGLEHVFIATKEVTLLPIGPTRVASSQKVNPIPKDQTRVMEKERKEGHPTKVKGKFKG